MMMHYEEIPRLSRSQVEQAMTNETGENKAKALLSAALYDADGAWVEGKCLEILRHAEPDLQEVAVVCLGHLARRFGTLDLGNVLPALSTAQVDPRLSGKIADTLDDISVFVKKERTS